MDAKQLDARVLEDLWAHPWSTWFQVEKRLDADGDIQAIVALMDVRDRLVRDGRLERFDPPDMPSIWNVSKAERAEVLMARTPSGEMPDLEIREVLA